MKRRFNLIEKKKRKKVFSLPVGRFKFSHYYFPFLCNKIPAAAAYGGRYLSVYTIFQRLCFRPGFL
jgi:hypothetical protein